MPIGRRSSGKRQRNDLDEYLAEVDSHLFCVTKADRACLNRDLKAHVKELTTDPGESDRFKGRYLISREQLVEEIGEPGEIASMYISSVGRKVPSIGLVSFAIVICAVFIGTLSMGLDRYDLGTMHGVSDAEWLKTSGALLAAGSIVGLATIGLSILRFGRFHVLLLYLSFTFVLFSVPFSTYLSKVIIRAMGKTTVPILTNLYISMILVNLIVICVIGVFIYLLHYRVMISKAGMAV